ncbi:DUF3108 domain-containing protein [Spirosoma endophyticum]|uniref:Uncharacterized protein n=1 Tax=Spirosoma endophyticum TaxID=662367 RepID=A0A1I1YJ36_9BACT|nr:hypothetical protein [Spirosoma endophyticum]SFE18000.1 hypothetical protein SAMN05216167_11135 [Spirosoma endophyticum]
MNLQTTGLLLLSVLGIHHQGLAQARLVPSTTLLANYVVTTEKQNSNWYMWQDSAKRELATITTTIQPGFQGDKVLIVQKIAMKGAPGTWVDTTVALQKTMAPIYHSSFNGQRNMVLAFNGQRIEGYYKNQKDGIVTLVNDQMSEPYFDSNIYPHLIRFLPLKAGYQATIPIYDFNPRQHGLLFARVTDVKETMLTDKNGQKIPCYAVQVTDDLSPDSQTTHYIAKKDRAVVKLELVAGSRRMSIEAQ